MKKQTKPVLGGLNTKLPATMMDPQFSPDLLNVVTRDGVTVSRGGLPPLFLDRMQGDSIEVGGYRTTAALADGGASATTDGEFVVQPGYMLAGHRDVYNQGDGSIDVSLWFQLGKLTAQQGGNASGVAGAFFPAPYTVKLQPIISKGPCRKSESYRNPWVVTPATQWGTASNSGLHFCVYLWNDGTGTAPVWSLRLSAHVLIGGTWTLQTVASTVPVTDGGRYHILAQVTTTRVALRVARMHGLESAGYVEDETVFAAGTIGRNLCPVMVFDCPQQLIVATAVGSATQRPGFGLSSSASGSYWFGTLRPDGAVDQVAIWSNQPSLPSLSSLERTVRLPYTGQAGLASLWSMGGHSLDYVREETGRGNHMFLVPRGPISVAEDGGKEGGSWFYNGNTSFTLLDTNTPNWRFYDATAAKPAAMYSLVRDNMAHGIIVEFWPDSIETTNAQVIAEIHGVLRLELDPTGIFKGWCRSGNVSAVATTAQEMGLLYQGTANSVTVAQPGHRYTVALMRREGGANLDIYVDGQLEGTVAVAPSNFQTVATSGNSHPPGGVTIGFGSFERMMRGVSPTDPGMATSNEINTDSASGFVGRVETFRIVTTADGVVLAAKQGPEDPDSWRFSESRLWSNPVGGNRLLLFPRDGDDTVRNVGRGAIPTLATQEQNGLQVAQSVDTSSALGYALSQQTMQTSLANDQFGHAALSAIGARVYHTLCYYRFNIDDRDQQYGGAYVLGFERRYLTSAVVTSPVYDRHPVKHTHLQESQVRDQVGLLGACWRCCSEGDILSDAAFDLAAGAARQGSSHRQRPYEFSAPVEIGPQWIPGMVPSADGTTPVTLIADYDVQIDSRRLTITACGRQLYWAKPAWDRGSLWFAGGTRSYCMGETAAQSLNLVDGNTIVLSMWVLPRRLDGQRVIASKRLCDPIAVQNSTDHLVNWMVYVDNGAIVVAGVEDGDRHWRWMEGTIPAGASEVSAISSLKIGRWNNIHVTMVEGSSVVVRVNGERIPLANCNGLTGAKQSDPMGTGTPIQPVQLYLGGFPEGYTKTTLPCLIADPFPLDLQSWDGLMQDFSARTSVDSTRWSGDDGYPYPRGTQDPGAVFWLPMDEGSGWLLSNAVDTGADLDVSIQEFYGIHGGMQTEENRYYKYVAFRDQLIVTNGAARPTSVRFLGFDKKTPFVVRTVGVDAPVPNDVQLQVGTTAGTAITDGLYLIFVTFVTEDGLESEASLCAAFELTVGPVGSLTFALLQLPRSHDPQVVRRRVYVSANGGGAPIVNRDVLDNNSSQIDFFASDLATGIGPPSGTNLPAPRGRHIAIAGTSLVLADLPDVPAGQNSFAFSGTDEVSLFTIQGLAVTLDSEDGKPITAIGHNLGQAFFAKRNSIHMLSVGAIVTAQEVDAQVRLVQASDGIGGGIAPASNLLYGCGDRGVFVFNNTDINYLSDSIEPTWRTEIDRGDSGDGLGLYVMNGAFLRPFSQYWVSVRRRGENQKDTLLCLDLATGSWTLHRTMRHSIMGILEAVVSNPTVAVGTMDGRVMWLDNDVLVDGALAANNSRGAVTLQGSTGLSGTSTSLTMAGANFPTALAGLQGATVRIVYNGGSVDRVIATNDVDTLTWEEPLPSFVSFTSFVVGAYDKYWTSPWIADGAIGQPQALRRLAIETLPQVGDLQVDVASVQRLVQPQRLWPTDAAAIETFTVDMLQGFTDRPCLPREQKEGAYHRFRFGTYGILDPFALIGYTPEFTVSQSRDFAGRRT